MSPSKKTSKITKKPYNVDIIKIWSYITYLILKETYTRGYLIPNQLENDSPFSDTSFIRKSKQLEELGIITRRKIKKSLIFEFSNDQIKEQVRVLIEEFEKFDTLLKKQHNSHNWICNTSCVARLTIKNVFKI